ncbi:MAG: hypothetical protein QM756_11255 [Polyangiaceae bacterium]
MKIRAALRYTLTVLALVPFTLAPVAAEAKPKASKPPAAAPEPAKKKSLAFAPFEGKKNPEVRAWLREAMQSGFELTDADEFKVKADAAAYAKMGQDLGTDAVVVAKAEKTKLTLTIYQSSDARVLIVLQFKAGPGPKLKSIIEKRLEKKLFAAFGIETAEESARKQAEAKQLAEEEAGDDEGSEGDDEEAKKGSKKKKAAAEAEAEPEADKPSQEEEKPTEAPAAAREHGPIGKPFDIRGGVNFSQRSFTFKDTLTELVPDRQVRNPLRPYNGGLDLAVFARVELYPAGLLGADGVASNLGLIGGFSFGIPSSVNYVPSDGSGAKSLTTQTHEWFVGGRFRLPLGPTAGIGFNASYGQQRYFLKGDEQGALVPDVQYSYVRIGPDVFVDFGKITLEAYLGGRLVLSTGELQDPKLWFASVGARGMDAGLTLGYALSPSFSVLAGGEFKRYGFNFNPIQPGALYVAGGAVDQSYGGWVGASFHLPAKPASK